MIAEGDENAFREIFHAYNKKLYPAVVNIIKNEEDAKEIILDVFLKVWQKKELLRDVQNPASWLHRVAANRALDYLRKQQARLEIQFSETLNPDIPAGDVYGQLDAAQLKKLISEATEKLPESRRKIFILSREEGFSRSEISAQLGISESTVKNQLTSALKFIHHYISTRSGMYIPIILLWL